MDSNINMTENRTHESDSEDSYSDLDADLDELARRPCGSSSAQSVEETPQQVEMDISVIEEDEPCEIGSQGSSSNSSSADMGRQSGYGLRGGRSFVTPISYRNMMENSDDEEDDGQEERGSAKRKKWTDMLDLSYLLQNTRKSIKKLMSLVEHPKDVEWSRCTISVPRLAGVVDPWELSDGSEEEHRHWCTRFFEVYGHYMDSLVIHCGKLKRPPPCWDALLDLLSILFNNSRNLKGLSVQYRMGDGENRQITPSQEILLCLGNSGSTSLRFLKLLKVSNHEDGLITAEEVHTVIGLARKGIHLKSIELGEALLDDNTQMVSNINTLLEVTKESLETLILHGGFKGHRSSDDDSELKIEFPHTMNTLRKLSICPKYGFKSTNMPSTRNPMSKRWRGINLDDGKDSHETVPLKCTISMEHTSFHNLQEVQLGSMVEITELSLAFLRKLKSFRCGSRWDLSMQFPKTEIKRGSSQLEELQLPDGLKDPIFIENVAKFLTSLRKVWIYLPSVPVLRAFFKSFENSGYLEELYLKTQFDFETTMESCLLPEITITDQNEKLSGTSKSVLETLKEYKHFGDYIIYHNIELPLNEEDVENLRSRNNNTGIRALQSLRVLHLEHIPRQLLIPNPEDERRWYDHNFKFLSTTFGFPKEYPFSGECYEEIRKLKLTEFRWENMTMPSSASRWFKKVEYTGSSSKSKKDDDDIFVVSMAKRGTRVTIQPSMIVPNHLRKNKRES